MEIWCVNFGLTIYVTGCSFGKKSTKLLFTIYILDVVDDLMQSFVCVYLISIIPSVEFNAVNENKCKLQNH